MSRTRVKLDFVIRGDFPWLELDVLDFIEGGLNRALKEKSDGLFIEPNAHTSFTRLLSQSAARKRGLRMDSKKKTGKKL